MPSIGLLLMMKASSRHAQFILLGCLGWLGSLFFPWHSTKLLLPDVGCDAYVPSPRAEEQQNITRSVAQARSWQREILSGATIKTIASREDKSERAIRMNLSLAFLDPKRVKAVMQGTLLRGVSARRLVDAPATWSSQWQAIGLSRPV